MNASLQATPKIYIGLFLTTLATIMYEILLTRIFSVTMFYHFAFMAISVAMFGMTIGAILVYLRPAKFAHENCVAEMAKNTFLFAITIAITFFIHINVPFITQTNIAGLLTLGFHFVIIGIPFIFSGIVVTLALTRFEGQVSTLYGVDLVGAALGCWLLIGVLEVIDAPSAVFGIAAIVSLAALCFALSNNSNGIKILSAVSIFLFVGITTLNAVGFNKRDPLLRLKYHRGDYQAQPQYEKWNSFSRIRVIQPLESFPNPFGWGLSTKLELTKPVEELYLDIDSGAGTTLTKYTGDLAEIEHLKYDVTNLVHHLRTNGRVLVIGTGGNRDILSGILFGQKEVVGLEINENILSAVNDHFGTFTGNLDRDSRVTFVNDEARSYVTRHDERFDIIMASMIDTFAATAAGAYVLSENSLYTIEAWDLFLNRLNEGGVLSFSRWYSSIEPGEMYRVTSLAVEALRRFGISNPRDHILIGRMSFPNPIGVISGVGTILVSPSPFSKEDVEHFELVNREYDFDTVLSPNIVLDPVFQELAETPDLAAYTNAFQLDISAPTDDHPFFFQMLRFRDFFRLDLTERAGVSANLKAVFILGSLLVIVTVLTFLCIIVPLLLSIGKHALKGASPILTFFASIGFGFMLIEIALMQRLVVFLGHPVYSLAVVLFSLLLAGGIGSFTTNGLGLEIQRRSLLLRFSLLLGVIIGTGLLAPFLFQEFAASSNPVRIFMSVIFLFPIGICLGMAFPCGMKVASGKVPGLTPWCWGINGATSVCASVLAVAISLSAGIYATYWIGFLFYVLAGVSILRAARGKIGA